MFNTQLKEFSKFTEADGIACNGYNNYSYYENESGVIYFGGVDGITTFDPREITTHDIDSEIYFNKIKLRGGSEYFLAEKLFFNYKQNTFDIEFYMDDYKNNKNKSYSYMLDGFDKEWIENGNKNYASYTNIPPGEYVFRVKGINSAGSRVEESRIGITITNPPWRTPGAYFSYFLVIAIILYMGINRLKFLEKIVRQRTDELNIKLDENKILYDKVIQHERYKNNYFVNLSHELRTPLNVIVSTQQLIKRLNENNGVSRDKLNEYMNAVRLNADRLLSLINNIIDTSKIDSGVFTIKKEPEDIIYLVEETTLTLTSLAEKKNISLIVDPEVEEKTVMCDKGNIERCIINLVANALKFTPENGEIIVKIEDLGGFVKIRVKDNGIGIDKKYHKAIFDRFGQAYSQVSEEYGGSGLGLTLTSQIIELHNGTIDLVSELNEGAEFIITLPVE